ncbi:sensor histidine kinase [Clostridioides sp. ES-S-0108-01]|uniref:ATP-binding protein n=1 Tax=Clostridioides sp. ES-S-0108-01 TaxID=2770773 RepID=UPI001D0C8617|nr:sensor histidine kinase [Clostridioides sp. ES-S-0108-01]UDN51624.1 sensor histidine kinase [Clostridioides sp. ES-S-0107-01]
MLETDVFWIILTIISTAIECVVLKFLLDELSELRKNKLVLNSSILIAIMIITMLTIMKFNINIKLFICIFITYVLYKINYVVNKWKSILVSLLYWMLLIGFDSVGLSIVGILNSVQNMSNLLDNNLLRLELIMISKSLLIALIPLLKVIRLKIKINKKDCIYLSIPVISNIISVIVIFEFIFKDKSIDSKESLIILTISTVFLLSNISLVSIIRRIIKDNNLRIEHEITKKRMNMQYKYYLNLQEYQSKIRKLYHDMNNHIICIQNVYGKNEFADKYIKDINEQIKECNTIFNTHSMILDVILSEKKSICDTNNIIFLVDINFLECNFIEMPDVCSIFSNMIDNAIEACNKIQDTNIQKKIKLRGTVINRLFVIKCENTKINEVLLKNNKIITSKKDSFLHGIGINSIKDSVEKYNGNVEIHSDKNKFIVTIYIPLTRN